MPFVGGDSPPPARKRRWQDHDDDDTRGVLSLYHSDETCSFGGSHPFGLSTRKMAAPVSKRTRLDNDDDGASHLHHTTNNSFTPCHRLRTSQQSQKHKSQQTTPVSTPHRPAKNMAAPCHICHRRPTKKSGLDSFAQCEGCHEQTCFVCIRQCHGQGDMESVLSEQEALSRSFHMEDADADDDACDDPDGRPPAPPQRDKMEQRLGTARNWAACGHRSVVCSRCCVEKGPEGEVVCLGCLFGDESPNDMAL
ncbi:hypothetical protein MY11210_007408 [Beauveria gryllotalpidicola]